jgi:hypothetical protein
MASGLEGEEQLQLFDMAGHLLQQQKAAGFQAHVELGAYAAGTYLLTIKNKAGDIQTQKIVKE